MTANPDNCTLHPQTSMWARGGGFVTLHRSHREAIRGVNQIHAIRREEWEHTTGIELELDEVRRVLFVFAVVEQKKEAREHGQ